MVVSVLHVMEVLVSFPSREEEGEENLFDRSDI